MLFRNLVAQKLIIFSYFQLFCIYIFIFPMTKFMLESINQSCISVKQDRCMFQYHGKRLFLSNWRNVLTEDVIFCTCAFLNSLSSFISWGLDHCCSGYSVEFLVTNLWEFTDAPYLTTTKTDGFIHHSDFTSWYPCEKCVPLVWE